MRRSSSLLKVLLLMVTMMLGSVAVHAQFRASLRGTVTDPQGAVVPGATVTLVNKGTNETRTSITDDNGIYVFNALPAAEYKLNVERQGFKQKALEDVRIIPEQLNSLNVQIAVGEQHETVTVSDTTQALDTETATVSSTISSNQIQHMPSFNRDVFQLAQLTPGVFGDGSQNGGGGTFNNPGNQGPGGSGGSQAGIFGTENGPQIQSAGGQYQNNGITIDGISTVSAVWGGTTVITPSEDSVQDMKIVSNGYDAEFGRFSGAQIQVTSKSGTNQFHGSAFFKASRPGLNAYQKWNGYSSTQCPADGSPCTPTTRGLNRDQNRFNNYGGSIGGPLWKNKVFFFFNVETSPLESSATSQGWYETSQFHSLAGAGPIASQYLGFPGSTVAGGSIIPTTCAQIGLTDANCATLPGGLDLGSPLTTGVGRQDLTWTGNSTPGVGGGLDGIPDLAFYNSVNPTKVSQKQYNGRLDANLTQKDRLAFAIYWVPESNTSYNGPVRAQNLWHHDQTNDAFSVIWDHTFSSTLLNQARANAAGWRWNEVASNGQAPFGLPQDGIDNLGSANPQFFGAPGPSNLNQWTYSYNDVLTKSWGRHNIKVGGEFTHLYYLNNAVYAARPGYGFHNLWDFLNDAPYNESGQFDIKTGIPSPNRQDDRQKLWGFFAQDDFKIKPNLTINLGLRWSYFGGLYSKQKNLDVAVLGQGADALTGAHIRYGGNLYDPSKTNFGPVVGFAWSPTLFESKLVFRGGFGISYNQNEIAITANEYGNPGNTWNPFFNCSPPYNTNPTCAGTGILYQTATDVHSIFGYAPNPAATTTLGPGNLPANAASFINGFPSSPSTITVYHYSFDMQYELPASWVMSLGYQGNVSHNLLTHENYNIRGSANGAALNPLIGFYNFWDNVGRSNYNGLIATLNHNFKQGYQLGAQYTWSKAMDDTSGPYYQDPYPYNVDAGYGRSNYNVADAFKLYGLWQPTFFHGSHSWMEKVVGGWSLSGIWNVHSGFPWDPIYNVAGGNLYYGGAGYGQLRPAAVLATYGSSTSNGSFEGTNIGNNTIINPVFSGNGTTFFTAPGYPAAASFPNISAFPAIGIQRNSLNGPGYRDVDASLSKAFGLPNNKILGEGARFEIRADFYNLFNQTNIDPNSIDTNLGTVNPDGTLAGLNSHFGVATRALGSRTVQLQARFSF